MSEHVTRVITPPRLACGSQMVCAGEAGFAGRAIQGEGGHIGDQVHACRRADLIRNDPDRLALGGKTKHRLQEIRPARAVDPARAKDEVLVMDLAQYYFSLELRAPVNGKRPGGI